MNTSPNNQLPSEYYITPITPPFIVHRSKIRCGSYTSEWIARVVGVRMPPANMLLKGPLWFDIFRPILPRDMRELLRAKGVESNEVSVSNLTDEEKISWIKHQIVFTNKPPALLIKVGILHWIAVAGYDDSIKIFYIYDPLFGKNSLNNNFPLGNATYSYDELLLKWRGRWHLKYLAIVVTGIYSKLPFM